jgi:hypothetical protein
MKFLGIVFDKYLSFNKQIEAIKSKVENRLNILKHLAHKSWKLSKITLINIYKSLIRSILDYSNFIVPMLSEENKRKLETCQNSALRIIFHCHYNKETKKQTSNLDLLQKAGLETIEIRSKNLTKEYFFNAVSHNNELITELLDEFSIFKNSYDFETKTLLDLTL